MKKLLLFGVATVCALAAMLTVLSACSKQKEQPAVETVVEEPVPEPENCLPDGYYKAKGNIGGKAKFAFTMEFAVKEGRVAGFYSYNSVGIPILLKGTIDPEGIEMEEFANGKNTGDFAGKVDSERMYSGVFSNHFNGKTFDYGFTIEESDSPSKTFEEYWKPVADLCRTNEFDKPSASEGGGDASIDELIDSYERYMTECIGLARKIKEGDTSAMTEYHDLYEKAEDLSKRLEDMKGEMSHAQANRLARIAADKGAELGRLLQ